MIWSVIQDGWDAGASSMPTRLVGMSEKIIWEYFTAPVLIHATKQILDNYGSEGWELVTIMSGPNGGDSLVAYFKRPKA